MFFPVLKSGFKRLFKSIKGAEKAYIKLKPADKKHLDLQKGKDRILTFSPFLAKGHL